MYITSCKPLKILYIALLNTYNTMLILWSSTTLTGLQNLF